MQVCESGLGYVVVKAIAGANVNVLKAPYYILVAVDEDRFDSISAFPYDDDETGAKEAQHVIAIDLVVREYLKDPDNVYSVKVADYLWWYTLVSLYFS